MFLSDKRALVTGSTSGIGLATARALHAEGAEVILIVKAGQRVVRLWLQIRALNPARGCGGKRGHPAPIHQIGDKRGDEHRLPGPRETRDAEAECRVAKEPRHPACRILNPADQCVRNIGENHPGPFPLPFRGKICRRVGACQGAE